MAMKIFLPSTVTMSDEAQALLRASHTRTTVLQYMIQIQITCHLVSISWLHFPSPTLFQLRSNNGNKECFFQDNFKCILGSVNAITYKVCGMCRSWYGLIWIRYKTQTLTLNSMDSVQSYRTGLKHADNLASETSSDANTSPNLTETMNRYLCCFYIRQYMRSKGTHCLCVACTASSSHANGPKTNHALFQRPVSLGIALRICGSFENRLKTK